MKRIEATRDAILWHRAEVEPVRPYTVVRPLSRMEHSDVGLILADALETFLHRPEPTDPTADLRRALQAGHARRTQYHAR